MKRTASILTFIVITAASLFAQGRPPGPPPGALAGIDPLVAYLNLTADQKAAWDAARKEFDTAAQPLFDKQRDADEALHTALDAKSADACSIGTQMLAIRAIGDQIHAAHDALEAKLEAMLTADQKAKYEAFEAAAQLLRGPEGHPGPRH
jgi:Spy/CpxP family protein refolding chaperone